MGILAAAIDVKAKHAVYCVHDGDSRRIETGNITGSGSGFGNKSSPKAPNVGVTSMSTRRRWLVSAIRFSGDEELTSDETASSTYLQSREGLGAQLVAKQSAS